VSNANHDVTGRGARGLARKVLQRGKQAKAIIEIGAVLAAPIGGAPQTPTAQVAAQTKQLKDYTKQVRLPATRREIAKTLRTATRMKNDATTGLTRKDRRNLR
jgi:hypothetical protein